MSSNRHTSLEVLIPMIYGDGNLRKKTNAYLELAHSAKHEDYVDWKMALLKRWVTPQITKFSRYLTGGYGGRRKMWFLRTKVHHRITSAYSKTYRDGKKWINRKALEKLTPLSLAIWFMDDGTVRRRKKTRQGRVKKNPYIGQIALGTHAYTEEENRFLADFFKERFDLHFNVVFERSKAPKEYTYLLMSGKEECNKFLELVSPYVKQSPSMTYKISV